jgi:hypothetical protein
MEPSPANHRTAERHECLVDVVAFVETGSQAAELMQQSDRLFYKISKGAQATAVFFPSAGNGRGDAASGQLHSMRIRVVSPIGHHFPGLAQRRADFAADGWNSINQRDQLRYVVTVGPSEESGKRHAAGIDRKGVLRAVFPAIHGAWSRFFPLCTARMEVESTITREKSISPAPRSLSSKSRWSWSHTPACRHSFSRFQRVMPQQPISCGKSSQGRPVFSTKTIPLRQTRSGTRGLPTPGTYGCLGKSGSTKAQSSSGTNGLLIVSSLTAMPPSVVERFRCDKGQF